ncbi:MAG: VWA domain-containing protein [Phycisphaeraceae bacterium]|nr:VWA domain-containing protein [Phycisphaeraceae bacterium]
MLFRFDHPELLWLLLLGVPMVWLGVYSLKTLDPLRRWIAIGLRISVLTIIILMLAGLQFVRWHTDLTVVSAMDVSDSVMRYFKPPPLPSSEGNTSTTELTPDEWARRYLKTAAQGKRTDDLYGEVIFKGEASVRAKPSFMMDSPATAVTQMRDGTDAAEGIRMSIATQPPDSAKRIIFISDGNPTVSSSTNRDRGAVSAAGELLAAAYEAKSLGIPIDVLPLDYEVTNEVMVDGIYVPAEAREGQTVALRVVLRATNPVNGQLYLKHDGYPLDLNGAAPGNGSTIHVQDWAPETESGSVERGSTAPLTSGRFTCVRLVELPMSYSGANRFQAIFEPAEKSTDQIASNNQAEAFTLVHGQGKVLFVDTLGTGSGESLPRMLQSHNIKLDLIQPGELPVNLADLQRYDAVIFQNVPQDLIMSAQQRMLTRYVGDMGGGFLMIGGPDSFGAGGWTNTPIDKILPVECRIPSQTVVPSGALVIVIDRSGSMMSPADGTTSKQVVANEAAVLALATLFPQDLIGVLAFSDGNEWIVPLSKNTKPLETAKLVRSIQPMGGTNIFPALVDAYDALAPLKAQDAAAKHIILLTDGQSPDGDYAGLTRKMREKGITLSTIGVGSDVDNALLSRLAQMGKGQYHPIVDPKRLPQVFIKEARSVRKNLIKEIPFRPRLIATGSPVMAGINSTPELKGLVLTGPKQDRRVFMPMVGTEGEPLFAHWQVGLGRTAAFTSDATNHWATSWLEWSGYADFWLRTIRMIARPSDSRQFDMISSIRNNTLYLRLDTGSSDEDENEGFGGFLNVSGSILLPDGSVKTVVLNQIGPGIYEASVPAINEGNYIVTLFAQNARGERRAIFGGASRPGGMELRNFRSNRALLEQVAQITGGRVLDPSKPTPGSLFDRTQVEPTRSIRPVWRMLLFWLFIVFLLDVACRRIAWNFGTIWTIFKRWLGAVAGAGSTRSNEAPGTLDALKVRARVVNDQLAGQPLARPEDSTPTVASGRKFEASGNKAALENFAQAVGGAQVSESGAPPTAPQKGVKDTPVTTSRLLDAKRRAQKNIDDRRED